MKPFGIAYDLSSAHPKRAFLPNLEAFHQNCRTGFLFAFSCNAVHNFFSSFNDCCFLTGVLLPALHSQELSSWFKNWDRLNGWNKHFKITIFYHLLSSEGKSNIVEGSIISNCYSSAGGKLSSVLFLLQLPWAVATR